MAVETTLAYAETFALTSKGRVALAAYRLTSSQPDRRLLLSTLNGARLCRSTAPADKLHPTAPQHHSTAGNREDGARGAKGNA